MDTLTVVILAFGVLEVLNVAILYFAPGFTQGGNGVAVFNAWEKSKEFPELHQFIRYLVNWVAGTKLIFLALLVVVVVFGTEQTKLAAVVALVFTVATFYWRLSPLIRTMDESGWITPKGYSRTLAVMIGGFLLVFVVALGAHLFFRFS
jgi:hypothetical protein